MQSRNSVESISDSLKKNISTDNLLANQLRKTEGTL